MTQVYPRNIKIHSGFKAVVRAVPLEDVAARYTSLEAAGGKAWYVGKCPLPDHPDRTPSFYIYPPDDGESGGRFYCFGCGEHGDVIELHFRCGPFAEMYEAMLDLAYEYDVQPPEPSPQWKARQARQRPLRDGIEEVRARIVHRRLYRIFRVSYLDNIEDEDLRREEAEHIWRDLEPVARGYARQLGVSVERA